MAEGGKDNEDISIGSLDLPETSSDELSPGHSFDDASDDLSTVDFKQITEEYEQVLKNGGIQELQTYIKTKLNAWKTIPVNIAVIGRSGVGKSTLINAIRDLKADDEGAAITDVIEATKYVTHYPFKRRSNIVLWDLPGVGTRKFKKESYEEIVNNLIKEQSLNSLQDIAGFIFYLLLTATRFTDDDVWLANKIENSYKKKYYLVRTKIAHEIRDERSSRKTPRTKEELLDYISTDLKRNLEEEGLSGVDVYLIDSLSPEEFDFEKLKGKLIADAPNSKIEAIAFSLSCRSKHLIETKQKALLGPTKTALFLWSDIESVYKWYKRGLNLTDEDITYASETLGISVGNLISKLELRSCEYDTKKLLTDFETNFGKSTARWFTVCTIGLFVPYVGQIPACVYLSIRAFKFMKTILNMCVDDAMKIQHEICKMAERDAKRV